MIIVALTVNILTLALVAYSEKNKMQKLVLLLVMLSLLCAIGALW